MILITSNQHFKAQLLNFYMYIIKYKCLCGLILPIQFIKVNILDLHWQLEIRHHSVIFLGHNSIPFLSMS